MYKSTNAHKSHYSLLIYIYIYIYMYQTRFPRVDYSGDIIFLVSVHGESKNLYNALTTLFKKMPILI